MCVRALSIKCSHRRVGEGLHSNVKISHDDFLILRMYVCTVLYMEAISACVSASCIPQSSFSSYEANGAPFSPHFLQHKQRYLKCL